MELVPGRKMALVTGAGTGIGVAIAMALSDSGHHVMLSGRNAARLASTAAAIATRGGTSRILTADLSDRNSADALAAAVRRESPVLHTLVHNAGTGGSSPLDEARLVEFDRRIETNLVAPMRLTRALLPVMPRDGTGRIVLIASVLARFGVPDAHAYCASKAGIVGFARALSRDLGRERITVNAVCPGWVRTDMAEEGFQRLGAVMGTDARGAEAIMMKDVPTGRVLEPAEIAALVAFLVGPGAGNITGTAYAADGGVLA